MQIIIAVIGFVLSGVVFFFYTKPTYDSVKSVQTEIAQYDAVLEKAAELQRLNASLLSRFNAFKLTDIERLEKLLPDHVNNVRLILDLDNLAGQHGIALQNVDVSSSLNRASKNQIAAVEIGTSDQKYDSLTFTFSTRASYATFSRFLRDLELSLRIVDLVSLTMSPSADAFSQASGSVEPQYTFNVVLRTYWLK